MRMAQAPSTIKSVVIAGTYQLKWPIACTAPATRLAVIATAIGFSRPEPRMKTITAATSAAANAATAKQSPGSPVSTARFR